MKELINYLKNKRKNKKIDYPKYSKEHLIYLKKIKTEKWIIKLIQISILILLFLIWELFTKWGILDPFFTSSPSRMLKTAKSLYSSGELFTHIGITLYETVIGFVLSTALGYILAVVLWWSDKLKKILEPYIVVLNSLPKIALGPLIIIWVGAGTKAIIVMCILICVIVTTLSLLGSFLSCDKDKILLMKSMGANKIQTFFKLIVPNSMPDFISVLKINVGLSWIGTIMGEYLVSKAGLGYLIVYGGTVFKLDLVMTSTVILCLLAGGMYFVISRIEAHFKKWQQKMQ